MLLADYLLPGSIMLLKFLMKMTTEAETNATDTLRALLVFPIDVAFLSLSYGAAVIYTLNPIAQDPSNTKMLFVVVIAAFLFLIPVIVFAKKADRAFVLEQHGWSFGYSLGAYILAILITSLSVAVGRFF